MTPRINEELKFNDLFPYRDDKKCRCGCGRELTGKKTCWYNKNHSRNAWKIYSFKKGWSAAVRSEVFKRDGGRCKVCGRFCGGLNSGKGNGWEAHHVIPVSQGGVTSLENLQTCCVSCHKKLTKELLRNKK